MVRQRSNLSVNADVLAARCRGPMVAGYPALVGELNTLNRSGTLVRELNRGAGRPL